MVAGAEVHSPHPESAHPLAGALSGPSPAAEDTAPLQTGAAAEEASGKASTAESSSPRSAGSSSKPVAVYPESAVAVDSSSQGGGKSTAEPIDEVQKPQSGGGCCIVM